MKKFLTIAVIVLSMMVFVACGGNKKEKDNTDTGDTVNDEDTADITDTPSEGDIEEPDETPDEKTDEDDNCTALSLDWSALVQSSINKFYVTNEDYDPVLQMQFYQDLENGTITAGTYDLGSEINSTFETCTECVFVFSDYVEEDDEYSKIYYQKSGSLTIDKVDDYNNIVGTITAVLAEATINDETLETLFVENGACLKIESAAFDSGYEEPCVPECNGKECGYDGCGGICGSCENGKGCSENFECVDFELPATCETISIDWSTLGYYYGGYYTDGEDTYGLLELINGPSVGVFDLGSEVNSNYSTYTECVRIASEDINYFQYSGELKIDAFDSNNNIAGAISGTFVETIFGGSNDNWVSTPVAGGSCVTIAASAFDTGVCTPDCTDKTCGDDGCGGICGVCGDGEGCNAESVCVPFEMPATCTGLSVNWDALIPYYGDYYAVGDDENGPSAKIEFWEDDGITVGTYDLGSEINKEYATCTECLFAYSDLDEDEYYTKTYFQHEGTLVISSVGENQEIAGTISAKLAEVVIAEDDEENIITTFISGGACFEIETGTTFATAAE